MSWDLGSYFPQFNGPEMKGFKRSLRSDMTALREEASVLDVLSSQNEGAWEEVLLKFEDLQRRVSHLSSYVSCLVSADSHNESYLKEASSLALLRAEFSKLRVELMRGLKGCADATFLAFVGRDATKGCRHYLARLREEARRLMTLQQETLAADLGVDGIQGWGRLYNTISGKLEFAMEFPDGRRERLPMSQRRSLLENADRRVRRAAFDGGNEAWKTVEDTGRGRAQRHRRDADDP